MEYAGVTRAERANVAMDSLVNLQGQLAVMVVLSAIRSWESRAL
jgi:hypothetical protein